MTEKIFEKHRGQAIKKWTKGITLKSTKRRGHYEYKHRNNTDDKKS